MRIISCLCKMHTTFQDLKVFNDIPLVVDDIIFHYTYGMNRSMLHIKTAIARSTTYNMPVPIAWKRYFSKSPPSSLIRFKFDWKKFLENVEGDLIDFDAVCETLNLLNWNALRSKGNAISNFVRTSTKTSLKRRLQDERLRQTVVHMVWHLLTCAGRGDFTTQAWKNNNYLRYLTIPYFNRPLTAYYPIDYYPLSIFDVLVHQRSELFFTN